MAHRRLPRRNPESSTRRWLDVAADLIDEAVDRLWLRMLHMDS